MILNLSQKAKSLIIKAIRKTDINEIMPIPDAHFSHFSTPISLRALFLSNFHFPDFQYIAQIFRLAEDPPEGSRFQAFGLHSKPAFRGWLFSFSNGGYALTHSA